MTEHPKSMGRPRAFDEAEVLERAMQSFWKRGFERTTLEHLLEDTRLSKSSLYNAFGGKEELFKKALGAYVEQHDFVAKIADAETGPEYLRDLLVLFGKPLTKPTRCCLLQRTMLENATSQVRPKNLSFFASYLSSVWEAMTAAVSALKRRKRNSLSDEEKAAVFVSAMLGCSVIARNGRNEELLNALSDALIKIAESR